MRCLLFAAIILSCLEPLASAADFAKSRLTVTLSWRTLEKEEGRNTFGPVKLEKVAREGLWLAFLPSGKEHLPGVYAAGSFRNIAVPIEKIEALRLAVNVTSANMTLYRQRTIFDAARGFGFKKLSPRNVYHVLVLSEFAEAGKLSPLPKLKLPVPAWSAAFARVRGLAANYAAQSDTESRKYEKILKVRTEYSGPRLVMIAEEWLDVPKKVMVKKGGGMFGNLGAKLEAAFKPTEIPTYTVDVLHNDVKVTGKYAIGFRAARSMHNDVLEGKVLAAATGGKRRVITASVVFSQLQENVRKRKLKNRVIRVTAKNIKTLEACRFLHSSERKGITDFLSANRDWQVLIPADPVIFFERQKKKEVPIYATYAWFRVHPESGRMIGVLCGGARGAMTDELSRVGGELMGKVRNKVTDAAGGGSAKAFFSQLAGMYVSAGGIIDAIGLTIADPSLADMKEKDWRKFLAMHSLELCSRFLEENAETYDNYPTILGFWQGAMIFPSMLGGPDAAKEAARRAARSCYEQAKKDAKEWVDKQLKEGKKVTREAFDEYLEKNAPRLKETIEAYEAVNNARDKGEQYGKQAAEYRQRYDAFMKDLRSKLK